MVHKRHIVTPLALGATLIAVPATAHAGKDMKGRFGIGGARTLSGFTQIHGRYFVLTHFSLGFGFGLGVWDSNNDTDNDGEDDVDPLVVANLAPEFMAWLLRSNESKPIAANFGIGGRIGFIFGSDGSNDPSGQQNDPFEIDIEIPITAEVFLGDHFSLAPEVGIVFRIIPGRAPADGNRGGCQTLTNPGACRVLGGGPGFGFEVGHNTGFFGGGSFHFYF